MSAVASNLTFAIERIGICKVYHRSSALPVIVMSTAGILANGIVICAVLLDANLRKSALTKMILCLFSSSFLLFFCYMVLKSMCLMNSSHLDSWKIVSSLLFTSNTLHYCSTCVLALSRLIAMMKPVKYKIFFSSHKIGYLIIVLWILSVLIGLLLTFLDLDESKWNTFATAINFTFACISMTSLAAYIKMFVEAYKGRRLDANQETEETRHRVSQWRNEITKTLFVIIVLQSLCSFPHSIYHLILPFKDVSSGSEVIHIIQCIQFLIDPLLFVTMVREYRNATVQLFSCIVKRCPNNSTLQEVQVDPTNITHVVEHVQQISNETV